MKRHVKRTLFTPDAAIAGDESDDADQGEYNVQEIEREKLVYRRVMTVGTQVK